MTDIPKAREILLEALEYNMDSQSEALSGKYHETDKH